MEEEDVVSYGVGNRVNLEVLRRNARSGIESPSLFLLVFRATGDGFT